MELVDSLLALLVPPTSEEDGGGGDGGGSVDSMAEGLTGLDMDGFEDSAAAAVSFLSPAAAAAAAAVAAGTGSGAAALADAKAVAAEAEAAEAAEAAAAVAAVAMEVAAEAAAAAEAALLATEIDSGGGLTQLWIARSHRVDVHAAAFTAGRVTKLRSRSPRHLSKRLEAALIYFVKLCIGQAGPKFAMT
jgi:hypothetical protein